MQHGSSLAVLGSWFTTFQVSAKRDLGGKVAPGVWETRHGGQKVEARLESEEQLGCKVAKSSLNLTRKMKFIALSTIMALIAGVECGCVSQSHTAVSRVCSEPEHTLRVIVYSQALTDPRIAPFQKRTCYIAETDQLVGELRQKTGMRDLYRLSPLIMRRMRTGVCEKPGTCFLVNFVEITDTKATADFSAIFQRKDWISGQMSRFKLEKRDGTWVISKWELLSWM